ncbi:MAG: DUF4173 domain-containing protein [Planctomycetota bacterium]
MFDESREEAGADEPNRQRSQSVSLGWFCGLCSACLGLVLLADFLFWKAPLGWTAGFYGLVLVAAVLAWSRNGEWSAPGTVVACLTGLLLLWCFEQPGILTVLLALLGIASVGLVRRSGWTRSGMLWIERWLALVAIGWLRLFRDVGSLRRGGAEQETGTARRRGCLGWVVPVLLACVFLFLFWLANPLIDRWFDRARVALSRLGEFVQFPGRPLFWLVVAFAGWALLRYRSGAEESRLQSTGQKLASRWGVFRPVVLVRSLVLFNAVFAVQTLLDLYYLWARGRLPGGMTYAEYAHRGAYPLVITALLAAVFVLVTFRAEANRREMAWPRRLVYVWLAQNVFLVVSAAWRLRLYVDAYTLTRLRVAAAVWMLVVALGLVWIVVRIAGERSNGWLVSVNLVTAIGVLFVCSFTDVDGRIAWYNARHCREVRGRGPSIDVGYLQSLGPESLPALLWLSRRVNASEPSRRVEQSVAKLSRRLDQVLGGWRGWSLRRARLKALLEDRQ